MADEFREFITSQNSNNLLVARAVGMEIWDKNILTFLAGLRKN